MACLLTWSAHAALKGSLRTYTTLLVWMICLLMLTMADSSAVPAAIAGCSCSRSCASMCSDV